MRIVFHAWAARPMVEDGAAKGVIFESKAGRQAILAKVVVDTTGDGDMFARAGAEFDTDIEEGDVHHSMNTAWVVGGVDMDRWIDWKIHHPEQLRELMERGREELGFFQTPYVTWRPDVAMWLGPRQSGLSALDVDDMTEVEIRSHRLMEGHTQFFREHAPGFESAFTLQSAAQLGVRHTRRLAGVARIERKDWGDGTPAADEVGISPSISPKFPVVSVPYGSAGAARARRPARGRAAHQLRRQQPRLHARDPAMLADRPRRGRRRGGRGQPRGAAARGRCPRGAGDPARAGRVHTRRRERLSAGRLRRRLRAYLDPSACSSALAS